MNKETSYRYCNVCHRTIRKSSYNLNGGMCGVCTMEIDDLTSFRKFIYWLEHAPQDKWFSTSEYVEIYNVFPRTAHRRLDRMHENAFVIKQLRQNVGTLGRACFWKINKERLFNIKRRFSTENTSLNDFPKRS